ncbi:DUF2108 domain-containing protein [Methanoplanus sp. FWC-SCC4]|uniref:DUF2108 domain-containing protein n=1 Tax=Methanochimaera problematica TaxID=2609417 RepID=A0AA97FAR4_9EURY|nr:EhaD family protein [Methanoplanus sp. FWC-SCC4]WOF15940.1 DUF2108 domain-containing protein [Methanoplanus sp. FWC-SCC4]
MQDFLVILFTVIAIIGAVGTVLQKNAYDKLISLAVLAGGVIPFVAAKGYLDVAIAISLIIPMTTIIVLQAVWRFKE